MAGIGFGTNFNNDNYVNKEGNGLGGKTTIVSIVGTDDSTVTQAELDTFVNAITSSVTNEPAFTIAAISGAVDDAAIVLALQGTGTPSVVDGHYGTDTTLSILATFEDNA